MIDKLFNHQVEGIKFLNEKDGVILADEMGLGKTRQAIIASRQNNTGTVLVVCPASIKINWEREIHLVYPWQAVCIVSGGKTVEKADWIVINYDILGKHIECLVQKVLDKEINCAIFDEAHYAKDIKTIRTRAMLAITEHLSRVMMLTGTPILNRPIELFSLLRAIKHPLAWDTEKTLATLKRNFSTRYCDGQLRIIYRKGGGMLRFWQENGATRLPELREMTKDIFLRRTKNEVLDLPDKIISVVETSLDREWQKNYDTAWDNYLDYVEKNPGTKNIEGILSAQGLVELTKLKQVCSLSKVQRITNDVINTVSQDTKVIIFSQYTETIKQIAAILREKKIGTVTLTGADNMQQRQNSVDGFQNDKTIMVFVANIKAAGIGINLTAASHVIFADMDWSPEMHRQAEDRAHRIGQTGTVNVYYYVVNDTIEEDIIDVLTLKQETIGVLTGGETTIKAFVDRIVKKVGITR